MVDFYQEFDQKIFMVDEHAYGEHYDPESEHVAWAAISAAFPHVIPVNIITDSFDYEIPRRLHEKILAIGGGKHAAMIVNTVQEPVDISFETKMQHPLFMAYAVGQETSTGTGAVKEITTITFTTVTDDSAQGKYFLINGIDANGEEHFAVWIDTVNDQSTGKPTIAGINSDNVLPANLAAALDPTNPTAAELSAAVNTIVGGDAVFGSTDGTGSIEVTNASAGAVRDVRDSGVDAMGITVSVGTQGSTTHTITPSVGHALPSFTLHIEQYNTDTPSESIYIDLFGCVVSECEISVDFEAKIIGESVNIKSVNYIVGVKFTNPPNFIDLIEPFVWGALKESASNYLIMAGTTDKTPAIVTKTSIKVSNDVVFYPGIGVNYATTVVNKKRTVELNIIGFTQIKDLFDAFKDSWDNTNNYYTNVGAKLNTVFTLTRTATNDYFKIAVSNWYVEACNQHVFNIDEGIKGIDITFTDAVPASNGGSIISTFTIADYLSETAYHNGTFT